MHKTLPMARVLSLTAVCLLALGLAGCSGGEDTSSSAAASASPSTSASETPAASASASGGRTTSAIPAPTHQQTTAAPTPTVIEEPTASASGSAPGLPETESTPSAGAAPAASGSCPTSRLSVSMNAAQGAAGSTVYDLVFTNNGSTACSMSGFPEVSFVNDAGTGVGAPAAPASDRTGDATTLEPGQSTRASLRSTQPDLYGQQCQRADAAGLRVSAPGSSESLVVRFPMAACASTDVQQLSVSAVGATG